MYHRSSTRARVRSALTSSSRIPTVERRWARALVVVGGVPEARGAFGHLVVRLVWRNVPRGCQTHHELRSSRGLSRRLFGRTWCDCNRGGLSALGPLSAIAVARSPRSWRGDTLPGQLRAVVAWGDSWRPATSVADERQQHQFARQNPRCPGRFRPGAVFGSRVACRVRDVCESHGPAGSFDRTPDTASVGCVDRNVCAHTRCVAGKRGRRTAPLTSQRRPSNPARRSS